MKTKANKLLEDLHNRETALLDFSRKKFIPLSDEELAWRPRPDKWSIGQCLEHLNRYGDHYLPELAKAVQHAGSVRPDGIFRSSLLGDLFARSTQVKKGTVRRLRTFQSMNPRLTPGTSTPREELYRFMRQQETYLALIGQAAGLDLNGTGVPTTFSRLIRLSLGDALRFTVYHNERHVWQANKVLARVSKLVLTSQAELQTYFKPAPIRQKAAVSGGPLAGSYSA